MRPALVSSAVGITTAIQSSTFSKCNLLYSKNSACSFRKQRESMDLLSIRYSAYNESLNAAYKFAATLNEHFQVIKQPSQSLKPERYGTFWSCLQTVWAYIQLGIFQYSSAISCIISDLCGWCMKAETYMIAELDTLFSSAGIMINLK